MLLGRILSVLIIKKQSLQLCRDRSCAQEREKPDFLRNPTRYVFRSYTLFLLSWKRVTQSGEGAFFPVSVWAIKIKGNAGLFWQRDCLQLWENKR